MLLNKSNIFIRTSYLTFRDFASPMRYLKSLFISYHRFLPRVCSLYCFVYGFMNHLGCICKRCTMVIGGYVGSLTIICRKLSPPTSNSITRPRYEYCLIRWSHQTLVYMRMSYLPRIRAEHEMLFIRVHMPSSWVRVVLFFFVLCLILVVVFCHCNIVLIPNTLERKIVLVVV